MYFSFPLYILYTKLITIKYLFNNLYFQISIFIIRAATFIIKMPCSAAKIFGSLNARFVDSKSLLKINGWPYILFSTVEAFYQVDNIATITWQITFNHSHKKRKDLKSSLKSTKSLEVSLNRVLFAAELEFPKMLVPRLPQHTSDVNNECAGKSVWSKQLYYVHVINFLEHRYNLILLFWH